MAMTVPLPPSNGAYQESFDRPPTSMRRKWTGRALEKRTEQSVNGNGSTKQAKQDQQTSTNVGRKPTHNSTTRGRQDSLRHVKNSKEVLRQRSANRGNKEIVPDGLSGGREGRQFTVANVGNNGRIYLRPLAPEPQQKPPMPPFVFPPATPPNSAGLDATGHRMSTEQARASVWSDTQTSKTPTRPKRAKSSNRGPRRSQSTSRPRTQSLSTADGALTNENQGPGAFRVVIDRAKPDADQPHKGLMPSLDVSIPHYRLGDPRFSARGTAFLHSSVYTGTSMNEDIRVSTFSGPEYERLFPVPPGTDPQSVLSRRHSHTSPQQFSIRITPAGKTDSISAATSTPTFHRPREPITASLYDTISDNPDDPAIVRYSPSTNEIVAASPARIITQITSKNFLDYELLSDFFLTVRAYLSTHDLEAYLLARFEWAINRFDDDGRVIRVRAFAALRHWILNYFPYDFVADRDLRVKFCQHLNVLSKVIRDRSNGSSDMKLILDLKKCWNGRCAIYWDNTELEDSSRRDLDISPGGIVGSRDSSLTHPSQLRTTTANLTPSGLEASVDAEKTVSALNNWFDAVLEAGNTSTKGRERQISVATSRSLPTSPISEQSIPAMSCTIPSKTLKKLVAQPNQGAGVHPVPVPTGMKRVCPAAPSSMANDPNSRTKHAHKRSGSFSDALRDKRASLPSMHEHLEESPVVTFPYSGSLIRGSILPPGCAYIDTFAPPSPTRELPMELFSESDDEDVADPRNPSPLTPGMKNIFGSIRRALSSKQIYATHSPNVVAGNVPTPPLPGPKGSKSTGALGESNVQQLEALKNHTRIDLLCADVTEMFQRALQEMTRQEVQPLSSIGIASGNEREQPSPQGIRSFETNQPDGLHRGYSETTYGSRSIVIVDDTGLEPPLPSLPSRFTQAASQVGDGAKSHAPSAKKQSVPANHDCASQPAAAALSDKSLGDILGTLPPVVKTEKSGSASKTPIPELGKTASAVSASGRPAFSRTSNGRSYMSTRSGSRSLRKYNSLQSGMTRSEIETTMTSDFPLAPTKSSEDAPQRRMLRRRPGGDLRANENVHDLEPITRSRSVGSITTYTDSVRGSELRLTRNNRGTIERESLNVPHSVQSAAAIGAAEKQLSIIRTHSSQPALRPSFEAAVAEFAQIPDDEGGDIEATLLKLEGRYRKSPVDAALASDEQPSGHTPSSAQSLPHQATSDSFNQRSSHSKDTDNQASVPESVHLDIPIDKKEEARAHRHNMTTSLYAESEESYDSTPLLERGLSTKSKNKGRSVPDPSPDVPRPLFSPTLKNADNSNPSLLSIEQGQDRGSTRRTRYISSIPTTTDSFLLDEDEFLSDLSSEISFDEDDHNAMYEEEYGSSHQLVQDGARTPRPRYASGELPSPPVTSGNGHNNAPQPNAFNEQHKPPTPEPSPVSRNEEPTKSSTPASSKMPTTDPLPTLKHNFLTRRHIPFIMSFDSEVLAQQFTIIEKDALNEINWLDLINMRWHHKSPSTQNWVEFLRTQDPTGIELVTARFNVIVKWALSEIVLTQSIEERALCIMKYIHIAQHCRKIHNYATLLQLTIALTSVDSSRLTKTWELVPAAEKKILQDLETLITPIKNFHNLRQEMETANSEDGCIPVVAMYIHDLTYNSQKPSQIASAEGREPLINFERYRTTASIVKSLLRLIDASAKYNFQPVEGALDRCLWMASLSDEMIRVKSKELE